MAETNYLRLFAIGGAALLLAAVWYTWQRSAVEAAMVWAAFIFLSGSAGIVWGTLKWLGRVDQHEGLRTEEKVQNKDALVIGAFFTLLLLLAYCVTGAAAAVQFPASPGAAVLLALTWALASASVGGSFGFLLGHPRRLTDDKTDRAGVTGFLRTGLDDMVDWLVKGLTTVILVQAGPILTHLGVVSRQMAQGLVGPVKATDAAAAMSQVDAAAAFAQPLIVCFTLLGALATCLVTRTYLTGALGRADRTTTGAFSRVGLDLGEVLLLTNAQRFLTTRNLEPGAEVKQVAARLSALSLTDLHSVQEYAMWAKAKSMFEQYEEALKGYEKAVAECDCDPALLLDYAVALHAAKKPTEALARLEQARDHLARATDVDTRKNVYKSFTFELLYQPGNFDRVLDLVKEFDESKAPPSGGLVVNQACAWGQKFTWIAKQKDLLEEDPTQPIKVKLGPDPAQWPDQDLKEAYYGALAAVKRAIEIDATWKRQLQLLLRRFDPDKTKHTDMTDLEVFERFNEFRAALDLPPFSEAAAKPGAVSKDTARESSEDPKTQIATGEGEGGSTKTPEATK